MYCTPILVENRAASANMVQHLNGWIFNLDNDPALDRSSQSPDLNAQRRTWKPEDSGAQSTK